MKRTAWYSVALGCAIFIGIGIASSSRTARAGDDVDCSSAVKWSSGHGSYDRNTLVAYKIRSGDAHHHGFKCDNQSCSQEPSKGSEWKDKGECSYSTDPH